MSFALAHNHGAEIYNINTETAKLVGQYSLRIADLCAQVTSHNDHSIFLGWRSLLKSQVADVVNHYSTNNWDGEGAAAISVNAASSTTAVIDALPNNIFLPEVAPDINGSISLDWNIEKNKIMSLVISEDKIIYAAIVGQKKFHGEVPFTYELPKEIEELLTSNFIKRT
jgi:hypothetical protein